jgi:hypothetical protein
LPFTIEGEDGVIAIVGKPFTVTVAEPAAVFVQSVELASFTEVNAYTKVPEVPVGTGTVAVFPEEVTV